MSFLEKKTKAESKLKNSYKNGKENLSNEKQKNLINHINLNCFHVIVTSN